MSLSLYAHDTYHCFKPHCHNLAPGQQHFIIEGKLTAPKCKTPTDECARLLTEVVDGD